jgi:uncharacterized protein YggE
MTRRTWTIALVIVALVVLAAGARAMAQGGSEEGDRRTITVSSTATVGSEPDQATLRLGIESEADDSSAALADNGAITDEVLAALRGAGVEPADVHTASLDVFRRTIDRRTPRERRVYVADGTLVVTVRDLDSVGGVIDAAVGAGATSVRGLRFEVSDFAEARARALEQAVEGARVKADAMASAAGASVAGVERIVEEGAARPVYEEFRAAGFAAGDAALTVEPPQELDTSVTISVTWMLG